MKTRAFRTLMCIAVMILLATTAGIPVRLAAQDTESHNNRHNRVRYTVKVLRTLGGTQGGANSITDSGSVMGWSSLPGDQAVHGVLWRGLTMTDLGTLGGPNSASSFPVKDDKGIIAGNSQTSETDRLGKISALSAPIPLSCVRDFVGTMAT